MSSRRTFLSAALTGLTAKAGRPIQGGFVNESYVLGHSLRDHAPQPTARNSARVPVVIVGGGIAGLSAAWHLDKLGFHDFVLLEMESVVGGNARSGSNAVSAYPWAAHYLPVPGKQSLLVRELMQDLGVLANEQWNERYLCFSPQERVYLHGRWQEGLEPEVATSSDDRRELKRFESAMLEMSQTGLFTIPMEIGAKATTLDRLSMREWLQQQRFQSPYLHWYVDYACRDDYGARMQDVSAWAGIHYFAARGQATDKGPLTWPEGNGWIVQRLVQKLQPYIRTAAPVYRIEKKGTSLRVHTPSHVFETKAVVFAAPTFLANYIVDAEAPAPFVYSPWVTANLTLDRMPKDIADGLTPAWDNVIYDSASLGYVVATHMSISSRPAEKSVWTWYMALADGSPAENRRRLLERDWMYWKEYILHDLSGAHPDIRDCVSRIDVMRMGHAMARPVPGMLSSPSRNRLGRVPGPVFFANSDLSGLSIFEEAQYRGVQAANRALRLAT